MFVLGLEPRHQRDDEVQLFVDLLATQEDHAEVGRFISVQILHTDCLI